MCEAKRGGSVLKELGAERHAENGQRKNVEKFPSSNIVLETVAQLLILPF